MFFPQRTDSQLGHDLFISAHHILTLSLFSGSYSADWRDRELKMILGGGGVEGWEVVTRRAPGEWPELVSDLANAVIVRTGSSKRRSRH